MSPDRLAEIRRLHFDASVRMSPERSFALLTAVRDLLAEVEKTDRAILIATEDR